MMLNDKRDEQMTLFKEIMYKKITVREAERVARSVAQDKVRKKELVINPEINQMEQSLRDALGTRVHIDRKELGGQIKIDFFSTDDLRTILEMIQKNEGEKKPAEMLENYIAENSPELEIVAPISDDLKPEDDRTKDENRYF